mgnify:FL=1
MAEIKFFGNLPDNAGDTYIDHQNSGIGFFGGAFGLSVPVDSWQESTFITDELGETAAVELQNTKYVDGDDTKLIHANGNAQDLDTVPNYFAPLNIRFEHDEAVRVKNCQLRIFDKTDITKHASGVHTAVYEVRHPAASQVDTLALNHRGLGTEGSPTHEWDDGFLYVQGTENVVTPLDLTPSPGISGVNGNQSDSDNNRLDGIDGASFEGAAHQSLRHDWYVALSASPNEVGSKTDFGLYFTLEYL